MIDLDRKGTRHEEEAIASALRLAELGTKVEEVCQRNTRDMAASQPSAFSG